jgi:hypothetical protein
VATFLPSYIQQIRWPDFTPLVSIALAFGVIAAHLVALQILNPVLGWIDKTAVKKRARLNPIPFDCFSLTVKKFCSERLVLIRLL